MDRLTHTRTQKFSTANMDKNGDAIIFDQQSLEFQQHKCGCLVGYTL